MKKHYLGLDLIRFFAASFVMLFHLGYNSWQPYIDRSETAEAFRSAFSSFSDLLHAGWVGVPIFFVISGFVIAFSSDGRTASEFAKARAWRLYPAACICATITLIFIFADTPDWADRYVRSLTLFPIGPWVDQVYWTLAVEIVFYALVAVVLMLHGPGHILYVGLGLGVVSAAYWLLRAADFATGGHYKSWFDFAEGPSGSLLLVSSGCYFGLGILIWWAREKGTSLLIIVVGAGCILAGVIALAATARFNLTRDPASQIRVIIAPTIWLAAVTAIIVSAYCNEWVARYIGRWPLTVRFLGLATYPIYLLHNEVGRAIMRFMQPAGAVNSLICSVAIILALAGLVVLVEMRMRSSRRQRTSVLSP